MQRRSFLRLAGAAAAMPLRGAVAKPRNIVVILADDIGYGDLGCYGATKVKTPSLDRLASQGIRFTDGHSGAATCTPTRYSLMTGEYAWRKKGTNILPGDANLVIDTKRTTLPQLMQKAGYTTGCVGKWHLGLGDRKIDWNKEVSPGPREVGFDYHFIIPATGDRTPCVFMENGKVVGLDPKDPIEVNYQDRIGTDPTGKEHPELLKMKLTHGHDFTIVNGISRIGYMSGGNAARWVDEDIADTITGKATAFIDKNKTKPFFLYFATHDIHVPRVPHKRFVKTSQCGTRCDAIQQFDWSVGELMKALDRNGLTQDTLIVVSSDNGAVLDDGYADGAIPDLNGHTPSGALQGGKYSPYEGGTRVPFLVRWPAKVKAGKSDALVSQIDLLASFATLTGQTLSADAAPDSFDVLPALLGESPAGREMLIEQSSKIGIRAGRWKLIAANNLKQKPELYDLVADLAETKDLAEANPAKVRELEGMLDGARKAGRTRR
ncbi:MAG: arylsulfatase [Bryobacteraceae bacterium]|nr:arylsulfatase [Bryobacteraceae bacterium]